MIPIDRGNGCLYFFCVGAVFVESLAQYLKENPDKMVIAVCGQDIQGTTVGYVVVVG